MKKDIEFQSDDVRIYRGTVTAENADIDEIIESVGVSDILDHFQEEELVNYLESRGYTVTNNGEWMMKKVIPAVEVHYCDKCGEEVKLSRIDASGKVQFVGRDWSGAAVGGITKEFELCGACARKLSEFFKD